MPTPYIEFCEAVENLTPDEEAWWKQELDKMDSQDKKKKKKGWQLHSGKMNDREAATKRKGSATNSSRTRDLAIL